MTYHALIGAKIIYDETDTVVAINDVVGLLEMPDGTAPTLTYTLLPEPFPFGDPLPLVNYETPGALTAELLGLPEADDGETYFGFVTHAGGTSYILNFLNWEFDGPSYDINFVVGGAALPDLVLSDSPNADWEALGDSVTAIGQVTSGPFAPGASIPLSGIPLSIAYTGEEVFNFNSEDDQIETGAGNDFVVVGGGGWNEVDTGAGDDMVRVDSAEGYTEAGVDLGLGNDILDLSGAFDAYVQLEHYDAAFTSGVTVHINGLTNVGRVEKQDGSQTAIIDVANVMDHGGFGVQGTEHNDVFNITSSEGNWWGSGFIQVRGNGGDDEINIGESDGWVRVDYRGAPSGIVADLGAGTVQDGFGGTDTIMGVASELRGSMYADDITGSDHDDTFTLMAGSDTLDGGGGFDTLRYNRSQVEAVTVDLEAGTASGVWRGESFTHSFTNIEAVRGSREDDDLLRGNGAGNILLGQGGDDTLEGRGGDDSLIGDAGDDVLDGGDGLDQAEFWGVLLEDATITKLDSGAIQVESAVNGTDTLTNIEALSFDDEWVLVRELFPDDSVHVGGDDDDVVSGGDDPETLLAGAGDDTVDGGGGDDTIDGGVGNDVLRGGDGADSIDGGEGADTLNGGAGDDIINGGSADGDRRDVVYGGDGNDNIQGGAGNDLLYGMNGNDTISGGRGADDLQGQDGDDVITGSAFSDIVFGGAGNDFVNGGFGHDLINGGDGADKFFHVGVLGHGSDWVQDYDAAEGDVLLFGNASATADNFKVNFAHTENSAGERSGDDDVEEAFVIYKPTGQIMWALVDGGGQDSINLQIGGDVFDLLG